MLGGLLSCAFCCKAWGAVDNDYFTLPVSALAGERGGVSRLTGKEMNKWDTNTTLLFSLFLCVCCASTGTDLMTERVKYCVLGRGISLLACCSFLLFSVCRRGFLGRWCA